MERKEEVLKAFIAIKRTNERLETIARNQVRQYQLNLNEFAVLELLYHKGRQPIQQVKERILIASSSTTYIIDKLCQKELVVRNNDDVDRRMIYAELTEKGRALIAEIFPKHVLYLEEGFSRLSNEEIYDLRQLLKKLNGIEL